MLTNFPNVLGAYNSANIFNSIALKLNFINIMGNALIVCKLQWSQQRQSWPLSNTNILCLKQLSFYSSLYLSRCQVHQEAPHLRIINNSNEQQFLLAFYTWQGNCMNQHIKLFYCCYSNFQPLLVFLKTFTNYFANFQFWIFLKNIYTHTYIHMYVYK